MGVQWSGDRRRQARRQSDVRRYEARLVVEAIAILVVIWLVVSVSSAGLGGVR